MSPSAIKSHLLSLALKAEKRAKTAKYQATRDRNVGVAHAYRNAAELVELLKRPRHTF